MNSKTKQKAKNFPMIHHKLYKLAGVAICALALSGCIESVSTETTPQNNTQVKSYTGPVAANADVLGFQNNVWNSLKANNRCGSCHGTDGRSPTFVRDDDVNLAYNDAMAYINLVTPDESRLATKVATLPDGHNCWLDSPAACGTVVTAYIDAWSIGNSTGEVSIIELVAPDIREVGASKNFTDTPPAEFASLHTVLKDNCASCHVDTAATPQAPYFSDLDVQSAYDAAKAKINLETPARSRLVVRLATEFHNCWDSDCAASATIMENAIITMAGAIPTDEIDPNLVTSKALNLLGNGLVASDGVRNNTNVIALYEFKGKETDTQIIDTSAVEPLMNLDLNGIENVDYKWVGGWGIEFSGGRAQAETTDSIKLHNHIIGGIDRNGNSITGTGEYSIEAWVIPGNVSQEDKPIISYSAGTDSRNFTFGQNIYNYDFMHRSSTTDINGQPTHSTLDADEDLQASQQHVVMTYDPINGREIYVNGVFTDDIDQTAGGDLSSWNDTFAFVLGNEVGGSNPWTGKLRLVAVYDRALSQQQIDQNFQAGVGEKFFLLFNISDHIGIPESYIMLEVSQFDSYSYLFNQPMFINLDPNASITDFDLAGMRIGINGQEAIVGQAFRKIDTTITETSFTTDTRFTELVQVLSTQGTTISLDKGPEQDLFFLTFAQLDGESNVYIEATCVPLSSCPSSFTASDEVSDIGMRTFEEIDATMSLLTGVSRNQVDAQGTYLTVQQQLPSSPSIDGFVSSHQIGVAQLAIEYCNAMIEDDALRGAYFPDFTFGTSASADYDTVTEKDFISGPLITGMLGNNIASSPDNAAVRTELHALMDKLSACGGSCTADRTRTVAKASCAAVLGSAAMLIQ